MKTDGQKVYVMLNQNTEPRRIGVNTGFNGWLTDILNDNEKYECHGYIEITVPPKSSMILIENDGSFKMSFEKAECEVKIADIADKPEAEETEIVDEADTVEEELIPEEITPGRYRHFKGNEYEVIDFAKDSETTERMVVYRALYGDRELWVRPYEMFREIIERDGKKMRRFERIE